MTVQEQILQLPKEEKLKLMEVLWEDLSRDPDSLESPAWHEEEIRKTRERLERGEEEILDWSEVKEELRKKFNES